jgi:hypothetical protein
MTLVSTVVSTSQFGQEGMFSDFLRYFSVMRIKQDKAQRGAVRLGGEQR